MWEPENEGAEEMLVQGLDTQMAQAKKEQTQTPGLRAIDFDAWGGWASLLFVEQKP